MEVGSGTGIVLYGMDVWVVVGRGELCGVLLDIFLGLVLVLRLLE